MLGDTHPRVNAHVGPLSLFQSHSLARSAGARAIHARKSEAETGRQHQATVSKVTLAEGIGQGVVVA